MEKRTCQRCGLDNYSSDSSGIWECHTCKALIPVPNKEEEKVKHLEVHRIFEEEQTDFAY